MRNPPIVSEVRRHLLRRGLSRSHAQRAAREIHEHWLDLAEEAKRQGLCRPEAEVQASARIGSAEAIAEELFLRLQETSWLARHPTSSFAALGLMITLLWWAATLGVTGWITGFYQWEPQNPDSIPPRMDLALACLDWIRVTSHMVPAFACCYIAQQYFCGWKPALWGCLVVIAHNAPHFFNVTPGDPGHGTVEWGYSFASKGSPELMPVLVPLLAFAIFWLWNLRGDENDSRGSGPLPC